MSRSMHLFFDSTSSGTTVTRRCRIERRDGERALSSECFGTLFRPRRGSPRRRRRALSPRVPHAGHGGGEVSLVHGEVSRTLSRTSPSSATRGVAGCRRSTSPSISSPTRSSTTRPPSRDAAVAFSGGVDSAFTVWRHVNAQAAPRVSHPTSCARPRIRHRTGGRGLLRDGSASGTAHPFRRRAALGHRPHELPGDRARELGARVRGRSGVDSALLQRGMRGRAPRQRGALRCPRRPLGSNPITDHLLSSASMEVVLDGAAFGRPAKIAALADWQAGCESLRVCWQGEHQGRNCGRCEKCQRTMFDFLCNRLPVPGRLPQEIDLDLLKSIGIASPPLRAEWSQILATATNRTGLTRGG